MMNEGLPENERAEVDTFGFPWHGVFVNGGVQLPNGAIKTFPATRTNPATQLQEPCPTNLGGHRPGDVSIVKVPGHVLMRTDADRAADAAQGVQWLDYGVISGRDRHLYGVQLGQRSWLYAVAVGEIYKIEMAAQPLNGLLRFTITRFGDFAGGDATPRTIYVPFPNAAALGFNADRYNILFTELCGHSHTGHVAAFGLGLTLADASAHDRNAPYPEAFFKVVVSGAGSKNAISISVSTIADAAACTKYENLQDTNTIDTRVSQNITPSVAFVNYQYPASANDGGTFGRDTYWNRRDMVGYLWPETPHPAPLTNPITGGSLASYQEFFQSRYARTLGEASTITERQTTRIIWYFVDAAGGLQEVKSQLYYKFSQVAIRYENDQISTTAAGYDTNTGQMAPGVTRYPEGTFIHSWETFAGQEVILELRLFINGAKVDTWRAFHKGGTQETHQTVITLGASYNTGYAGDEVRTDTSNPAQVDKVGDKGVATAKISSKCQPNPSESIMGYAPNWYIQDQDDYYYWPYIYLYSNTLVGIVEGQLPDKQDLGLNGPYVSVYLTNTASDGPVQCRTIYSYNGAVGGGGGYRPAAQRYAAWQPVNKSYTGLQAEPVVYL